MYLSKRELQTLREKGGDVHNPRYQNVARNGLVGIIDPKKSLLATIDSAVNGATVLIPDDVLIECADKVHKHLIEINTEITAMITRLMDIRMGIDASSENS